MYTRVLMGVLDLERVVWPKETPIAGQDLDVLARRNLWEVGKDYKHGTGHGVGSFLGVHEGPQGISRRSSEKLLVGMCVSNEPGYYEDGQFGIRIENVQMAVNHPKIDNHMTFYNLTYAPYCRQLIQPQILSSA